MLQFCLIIYEECAYLKTLLVLLACFTLLWGASSSPSANLSPLALEYLKNHSTIRVCIHPAFSPFEVLTLEGKYEGIAADLLRLVADKTGLGLQIIQSYTKEESLQKARQNQCDIVNFVIQTKEKDQWLIFTHPIFIDQNVLITREEHASIDDLRAIGNESIVLPKDSPFFERLADNFQNLSVFAVESQADALLMVLNKKIDMTIRPLMVAAHSIKRQGLFNLKVAGTLEGYDAVFKIGITQQNIALREILNQGIAAISAQEKEALITKYAPVAVKKPINPKVVYSIIGVVAMLIWIVLLWNYVLRRKVESAVKLNLENQKIILQQAKQAELGSLIGNISHQWREPLSNLSSINLMMIAFLEHDQVIDKSLWSQKLKSVENTLDFMSQTMQNFLEFYKPSSVRQYFNAAESIQQTLSIIETNLLADNVHIELQGDMNVELFGIKNEYMQVWLNIINNAVHAFHPSRVEKRKIVVTIDHSVITFCDNARGKIEEADLLKGVGLSMCRTILEKYDKRLSFRNTQEGVCVTVSLLP
jgi:ABC-type amino acid transport substrate-binding protein